MVTTFSWVLHGLSSSMGGELPPVGGWVFLSSCDSSCPGLVQKYCYLLGSRFFQILA